jgi:hypothetical protein
MGANSSAADAAVVAALDTVLPPNLRCGPTLERAVSALSSASGEKIEIAKRELRAAGVRTDAALDTELGGERLGDAISKLLAFNDQLRFHVDENLIVITTARDLNQPVATRIYDVRDLVKMNVAAPSKEVFASELAARIDWEVPLPADAASHRASREIAGQVIVHRSLQDQIRVAHLLDMMRWRRRIAFPFMIRAALLMLLSVIAALVLRARLLSRRSRMLQAGCCKHCGYDLRATPDRCPECGTEVLLRSSDAL